MIGEKIREMRSKKEVTQEELGKYCGVTRSTVANWEANKRSINLETCKKIAKYFNVSVGYLTGTKDVLNQDFIYGARAYFKSNNISQIEKDEIIQKIMGYYFLTKDVATNFIEA